MPSPDQKKDPMPASPFWPNAFPQISVTPVDVADLERRIRDLEQRFRQQDEELAAIERLAALGFVCPGAF